MSDTAPTASDDEAVLAQLLGELENRGSAVIDEYKGRFPRLVAEIDQLLAMHDLLGDADQGKDGAMPARLGDFRMERCVARGGMGEVWEAVHERLNRRVAVKVIRRGRVSPDAQARFLREQAVLARLHHTHIVAIHTAGEEGRLQYFVMPFIDGAALSHVIVAARHLDATRLGTRTPTLPELARLAADGGEATPAPPPEGQPTGEAAGRAAVPVADAPGSGPAPAWRPAATYFRSVAEVLADVADGLHDAHEAGVLHRDLKPSNIMVDRQGQRWIIDFGLAGSADRRDETETRGEGAKGDAAPALTQGPMGTPQYMAPEQYEARAERRSDVWGLGATLYELLSLQRAFDGEAVEEVQKKVCAANPEPLENLVASVPADLAAICRKALRKDPGQRYQTAREFAEDLRHWLGHEPTRARPGWVVLRPLWLWAWRKKAWAAAILFALLTSLTLVGLLLAVERAKVDAAERDLAASRERERVQKYESLVQRLQRIRLTTHHSGWSDDAWGKVREAREIRSDDSLRDEAAAVLVGLDARYVKPFPHAASSVVFDAEGKRLLMGGTSDQHGQPREGAKLWDGTIAPPRDSRQGGNGPVAFRADGTPLQLVANPKDRFTLLLRDVAKEQLLREFKIPAKEGPDQLTSENEPVMALTADGAFVAAAAALRDGVGRIVVWDAASGKLLRQIDLAKRTITALAITPGGSRLAVGDEDGRITLWPLPEGEPLALPAAGRTRINCLAFGPAPWRGEGDGKGRENWLLAAGDAGGAATIWDLERRVPQTYCYGSRYEIRTLAFTRDGATLASAGRADSRLWDVATGRLLLVLDTPRDYFSGLAFSSDGRRLAVSSAVPNPRGDTVQVWELNDGRGLRTLRGLVGQVSKVCFSPDSSRLAAVSHNWQAGIWDVPGGSLLHRLDLPKGFAIDNCALAFSRNGRRLAFAAGSKATLWDLTARSSKSWDLPPGLADSLVFDEAGEKLYLCRVETADGIHPPFGPDKHLPVCRIRNLLGPQGAEPLATIDLNPAHVFWTAAAPTGNHFVVHTVGGAQNKDVLCRVIEAANGKEVWSWKASNGGQFALDPAGKILAVVTDSGDEMNLVEIPSGKLLGSTKHGPTSLGPAAVDWLWHDGGSTGITLLRHDKPLVKLAIDSRISSITMPFNGDGNLVAWGNADGSVTLCNLQEVQERLAELGLGW